MSGLALSTGTLITFSSCHLPRISRTLEEEFAVLVWCIQFYYWTQLVYIHVNRVYNYALVVLCVNTSLVHAGFWYSTICSTVAIAERLFGIYAALRNHSQSLYLREVRQVPLLCQMDKQ